MKNKKRLLLGLIVLLVFHAFFWNPPSPQENIASKGATEAPTPLGRLMDPGHTTRLRRFRSNLTAFPTAAYHGCSRTGLCHFSNTCFSGHDHMLVFQPPPATNSSLNTSQWFSGRFVTAPRTIRDVPYSLYSKLENVFFAKKVYVVNCWRQTETAYNPAHYAMGVGKIFVAASGYHDDYVNSSIATKPFDMLLYHQCAVPAAWPWASLIDQLINQYAIENGFVVGESVDSFQNAQIFLPRPLVPIWNLQPSDTVICGETVVQEPFSVALYLGANQRVVVSKWREWFTTQLKQNLTSMNEINEEKESPQCPRQLRIAMWKRTEGSALRLLRNEDDIRSVAREFSDIPITILSANSKTPPLEQAAMFQNGFDILLTPHGSHLANMLYIGSNRSVIIELAAVYYDSGPTHNGQIFAGKYISSFGHLPFNNSNLEEKMALCNGTDAGPTSPCPRMTRLQFIQSDLVVNMTTLRSNLREAISWYCGADSIGGPGPGN